MKNDPRNRYSTKYRHGEITFGSQSGKIQHTSRDKSMVMYTCLSADGKFTYHYNYEPLPEIKLLTTV